MLDLPDKFYGFDRCDADPNRSNLYPSLSSKVICSRVLLSCTSEALVCLREDGMLLGVEAPCDAEWTPKRCPPVFGMLRSVESEFLVKPKGLQIGLFYLLWMGFGSGSLRGGLKCFLATC